MTCHHCRALNSDDEHRCRRCGRRLSGSASDTASEANPLRVTGALATAPAPLRRPAEPAHAPELPAQRPLFAPPRSPQKVIPFESIAGGRVEARAAGAAPAPARTPQPRAPQPRAPQRVQGRRPQAPKGPDNQQSLDFLPPAPHAARKLKTTVEAVIYCDAPVATKMHRGVATALDLSMILIAFGLFLATFHFSGGEFALTPVNLAVFGAAFALIAVFYGLLWLLAQADSPGKHWMHLRLTNFDGFPPEGMQRLLRFVGGWLSLSALGAGVLWALVDEESLTWHDHISKTFLTLREAETNFFRQR